MVVISCDTGIYALIMDIYSAILGKYQNYELVETAKSSDFYKHPLFQHTVKNVWMPFV